MTFVDDAYELFYLYGGIAQHLTFCICIILCLLLRTNKAISLALLLLLHSIYAQGLDLLFGEINSSYYLFESLMFLFIFIPVITRHEQRQQPYNSDNILLCFYRGEKGSFIMRFFELFGLPVKSMCIIAGDKCLMLKLVRMGLCSETARPS